MIGLIIIVGGLTRLTDSGLSITTWDVVKGILPQLMPISGMKLSHYTTDTSILFIEFRHDHV